ncbi:hypothetical protein GALMADRAFT_139575 [Galerina marginata CBS 339.88]|uniref:Uncharacterized protein n=1 Tax=Galerina marginata (strain CBS 339.88) TaxID=685588 RepID=A0A067T0E7_GALM3|nr:hypothetical protein GALMADRAFT_139575 [Galerina marginata CBS 339.88]
MSERFIFIDDTDPGLKYGPGWTSQNVTTSTNQLPANPLYGTLHALVYAGTPVQSSLSYGFNATYVAAIFPSTPFSSIVSCTIDGIQQEVFLDSTLSVCHNNVTLPVGVHQLEVAVNTSIQNSVLFDGLYLHSTYESTVDADIQIPIHDAGIDHYTLQNYGDTLNFDFVGYSMTFYAYYANTDNHPPSNAVYTIDDSPPVNFTVNNVATAVIPAIGSQILIQTPRYSLGPHSFSLRFLGTSDTAPIRMNNIIIQNSSTPVNLNLEIVPPIPSPTVSSSSLSSTPYSPTPTVTNTTSAHSETKSTNSGVIAGSVIAVLVIVALLILGVLFIFRRYPRTKKEVNPVHVVHSGDTEVFGSAEGPEGSVQVREYADGRNVL